MSAASAELAAFEDRAAILVERVAEDVVRPGLGGPLSDHHWRTHTQVHTEDDRRAGEALARSFGEAFPGHGLVIEDRDEIPGDGRHRWFIDPIDGSANHLRGIPYVSVTAGLEIDGEAVVGVVHDIVRDVTWSATRGGGAFLNDRPITASDVTTLDDASVLADARLLEGPIWPEPWPVMRFEKRNAIAYRMALVAAGAFDAAIALTPKWDWDIAAGALIAEEAGGRVSDHHGRPWLFNRADPRQSSLICAAPALHPLIVRRCAPIPLAD